MNATEAWVYGSVARQTASSTSDLDILVVKANIDSRMPAPVLKVVEHLPCSKFISVASYDWNSIEKMARYGSLFLLHLKLEGRPLWRDGDGPGLIEILAGLRPYQGIERDLKGFGMAIADVVGSLNDGGDLIYELSVIATVIRHCSVLACYLMGNPQFDRRRSIPQAFTHVGMGALSGEAVDLYRFRLAQARNIPVASVPTRPMAAHWCEIATEFVERTGALSGQR
jgi:hypothetical protein